MPELSRADVLPSTGPRDTLTPDIPTSYRTSSAEMDFERREFRVPMRDRVELYTLVLMKTDLAHGPILLERTPYGADDLGVRGNSQHLAQALSAVDALFVAFISAYIRMSADATNPLASMF